MVLSAFVVLIWAQDITPNNLAAFFSDHFKNCIYVFGAFLPFVPLIAWLYCKFWDLDEQSYFEAFILNAGFLLEPGPVVG